MFIDSMQFINISLDKLVRNMSGEDFKYLVEEFGFENLELLKQKDAYPYEYMNSFERFNEEKLPAKKYFYSSIKDGKIGDDGKISDGHISVKDYLTCEKIWDKFEMKNMGDYHDHYFKKDVLQLADVFEKFIGTRLKYYGLDPCHYFISPGLSWNAILKMTGVKLEKYQTLARTYLLKKNYLLKTAKRYAKANNKYMNYYDPKKQSTFISYLDMNNSYSWTMSEYLPYCKFEWLKNIDEFHVMSINEKNLIGYLLKADLEYPDKLPELHNNYPLALKKLAYSSDMSSNYC